MKMKSRAALGLLTAFALTAGSAFAQMNYQGRLTDANGDGVAGVQATLTFSVWDQEGAGAGTKLWGDFETNADLIDGRFNVIIGATDSMNRDLDQAFAGGARFLEIKVGTDLPLPRQQVLAAPEALNAATLGAANRKISISNIPTLGPAANSNFKLGSNISDTTQNPPTDPDNGADGLLIETIAGDGESAGIFLNGDTIALYSPGDRGLLNIYDEDSMDSANAIPVPRFTVSGAGGIVTRGPSIMNGNLSVDGDLSVDGNITAGTITGTLSTPSISIPDDLTVDSGLFMVDTSANVIGINSTQTSSTFNVRGSSGDSTFFQVENTSGTDLFEVNSTDVNVNTTLDVSGNLDVDGFTNLDGFTSNENSTINGKTNVNISGGIRALEINASQTNFADTFLLGLNASTPGFSHSWDFNIDSDDPGDADLLLLYNGTGSAVCEPNSNGWRAWSDASLKENITPLENCLESVVALKPSSYNYIASPSKRPCIGFLAQEVQEVLPKRVKEVDGKLTINYGEFGVLAVGAVKELKAELDAEKAKNAALEARLQAIEARLAELD